MSPIRKTRMDMKPDTTQLIIRLPTEMRIDFRTLCSALNKTQQEVIIYLISDFIKDHVDKIVKSK